MMGRHAQLAFAAVQQACADAGLDSNGAIPNRSRFGVILGVGMLSADVLVAGGADARVSPLGMMRYHDLGWLATRDDIEPAAVSAPFDANATGFVNAEGAGILVLESLDHARTRGARILAELGGYSAANDAHDVLMPHPCGRALTRATSRSLEHSGLGVNDVDAVFAPAASVPV